MDIAIIGGHGKVALRASRLLADRGHRVDAVIRNQDHSAEVEASGANPVVLDVETADTDALAEALRGHDAVVWSAGAGGGNPQRTFAVDRDAAIRSMEAAGRAGVKRYVMVSFATADEKHLVPEGDPFRPYMDAKIAADTALRGSSLDWTVLGPGKLTLDEPTGRVEPVTGGRGEPSDTSRGNVAQAIVAALEAPESIGKTLNFRDGGIPIAEWIRA